MMRKNTRLAKLGIYLRWIYHVCIVSSQQKKLYNKKEIEFYYEKWVLQTDLPIDYHSSSNIL